MKKSAIRTWITMKVYHQTYVHDNFGESETIDVSPYLVEWREYDVAHDAHEAVTRRAVEHIERAE